MTATTHIMTEADTCRELVTPKLVDAGWVKSWVRDFDLYRWRDRFKRDGLTTILRLELRETLTPRVSLREPFRWPSTRHRSLAGR